MTRACRRQALPAHTHPLCRRAPVAAAALAAAGQRIAGGAIPTHYAWWNATGCPNGQFGDPATQSRAGRACRIAGSAALYIVLGPVALVLALACCILCPGVVFSNRRGDGLGPLGAFMQVRWKCSSEGAGLGRRSALA